MPSDEYLYRVRTDNEYADMKRDAARVPELESRIAELEAALQWVLGRAMTVEEAIAAARGGDDAAE